MNISIFDIPKQTTVSDPINYWVGKKYSAQKEMLTITVDITSPAYKNLCHLASLRFRKSKSQQALIKAYYLYLFLIKIADLGDNLSTKDICVALSISQDTRKQIDEVLEYFELLVPDKQNHYDSIQSMMDAHRYNESFKIERFTYKFYYYPGAYSTPCMVRGRKLAYPLPKRLWKLLDSKGLTLHDSEILYDALKKGGSFDNNRSDSQESFTLNGQQIAIPNYQALSISPTLLSLPVKIVKQKVRIFGIRNWVNNTRKPVKFLSGRIYHAFHYTPKELRPFLEYKGSPLVELLDIKNAFFVFLSKAFKVSDSVNNIAINQIELQSYEQLTREGRLYEDVMAFEGEWIREVVKERLNAFKNDCKSSMTHYPEYGYFKSRFPGILNLLIKYPTYIREDGHEKKYIQKDAAYIETYIISLVCKELQDLGVTPFSLHDAIYVSKDDQQRLAEMGIDAMKIFWEKYDSMTDEDTISLIKTCRSAPNTLS